MRKTVLVLLIGIFAVAFGAGTTAKSYDGAWMGNLKTVNVQPEKIKSNELTNDVIPVPSPSEPSTKNPFPYFIAWQLDVSPQTFGPLGSAVVWDTLLWVSASTLHNTSEPAPNWMFIYNLKTQSVVDSFQQPTVTQFGWRDMTFDGSYVYASEGTSIALISPNPPYGVLGSISPSGTGLNPFRALACDNLDSLYSANWATAIWKFYNDGSNPHSYANSQSIFGLAYDPHGYLWGSSQSGTQNTVAKYAYPNISLIEAMAIPQVGMAGGCEFYKDTFLLYVDQTNAKVAAIQLYFSSQKDMTVQAIEAPTATTPLQRYTIRATVMNLGGDPTIAGVPVKMRIFGPDGNVYYEDLDQATLTTLTIGQTEQITFSPQWRVPDTLGTYTIKIWSELALDENPVNDTMTVAVEVTNWLSYCDWNAIAYYWPHATGEKVMQIVPSELNVLHPIMIDSLQTMFYVGAYPWVDSSFVFKIYAGDGSTLLYSSETLFAQDQEVITHYVNPPVTINSGNFYIGIYAKADSHPSMLSDAVSDGRSFSGTPGTKSWSLLTSGEWTLSCFVEWEARDNDVAPLSIVVPTSMVSPGVAITPKAKIKNFGLVDQINIPISCEIGSYTGTGTISLNSGDTGTVSFSPQWTPGLAGTVYDIKIYTSLGIDENNANDTIAGFTSSFVITNDIYSNYTESPPTIDGNIQTAEWYDAEMNDVSDVLGHSGNISTAGSAYLWVKNDNNNMYFACAMPYATTADNSDQIGLYLDENNDGNWSTDSTEGNYWLVNRESPEVDYLRYRCYPFSSTPIWTTEVGVISANLTNGYMQFEGSIPIGSIKEYLNVNPNGDTMKFWMYADDEPAGKYFGWWSQNTMGDSWDIARRYGNLVIRGQVHDVGVTSILAPYGSVYNGTVVNPKVIVRNYGLTASTFPVIFTIAEAKSEWSDTQYISLASYQIDTVEFDPWLANIIAPPVIFDITARTEMPGDENTGNDAQSAQFEVITAPPSAWFSKEPIIDPPANNIIKDGGALVGIPGSGKDPSKLYALLGTKTNRFKKYTVGSGWSDAETLLFGHKYKFGVGMDTVKFNKKFPGKGAALCYDGVSKIYATKGNGTHEFYAYDILTGIWTPKAFVPTPKPLKGGTSIRYFDGKVYLLAGGQKKDPLVDNFWMYDPLGDTTNGTPWTALGKLPLGPNTKVWKDGASIIEVNGTFYAVKSADKANLFYSYDWGTSTWTQLEDMPIDDSSYHKYKKKLIVKDGAATATDDDVIYATKGGGTEVFWKYTPLIGWERLERLPIEKVNKKHAPKTGAAMAYADDKVWLLVGNKNPDFWCYGIAKDKSNVKSHITKISEDIKTNQSEATSKLSFTFNINPNPFTRQTTIRYTVPVSGNVSIRLYNASGKLIKTLVNNNLNIGTYSINLLSNKLAKGVYFVKYDSDTNKSETKLIIQ